MGMFEINEMWIPAMGARTLSDLGFEQLLEEIRVELGPGSVVKG